MDKDLILKYQEKDSLLFKLERELDQNENKRIANQMIGIVKELQTKITLLETEAEQVVKEFEDLQAKNASLCAKVLKLNEANANDLTEEQLDELVQESANQVQNLSVIEKKCSMQAERVSAILNEFEESKKKFGLARAKHKNHKELYEQAVALSKPSIEALKKELQEIEKELPTTLIAKYKLVRQDKIFPVFVPLSIRSCGGCQMELSTKNIETLKEKGYIECENCRRQIYGV